MNLKVWQALEVLSSDVATQAEQLPPEQRPAALHFAADLADRFRVAQREFPGLTTHLELPVFDEKKAA